MDELVGALNPFEISVKVWIFPAASAWWIQDLPEKDRFGPSTDLRLPDKISSALPLLSQFSGVKIPNFPKISKH